MTVNVPDVEACKAYAGANGAAWDTARVTQALAAERAAQASRCRVPATDTGWPADLAEALMRRVLRNMAMRALPLGAEVSEGGVMVIGSNDPEVRRLERPYRKGVLG